MILAIVLLGTLWPLAAEAMGDRISVGPPYFNKTTIPLVFLLFLLLAVGPLLKWRGDDVRSLRKLAIPGAVVVAIAIGVWATNPGVSLWAILGLALAAGIAIASLFPLLGPQPFADTADHLGNGHCSFGSRHHRCRHVG